MQAGLQVPDAPKCPSTEEVLSHFEILAKSRIFSTAPRKVQLLRYLIAQALDGKPTNEYTIGVDVFERPSSFNPSEDSIVRTEVTRLRQKLKQYYLSDGGSDSIRIELPPRSYTPLFVASGTAEAKTISVPKNKFGSILWASSVVVAIIAAATIFVWNRGLWISASPSVAILPFVNLTGDPAQEFLGESIADELTEALAEVDGIRVVARTSAFQFRGKEQDVREIARRLNVGTILEGSVKQSGSNLEVGVQLVSGSNGYRMWSKVIEAPASDVRAIEAEIAESTRRALAPTKLNTPLPAPGTPDVQAHNLYLQAVYSFYKGDPESLRRTVELARQAVGRDPSFVRAHLLIVKAERNLASLGLESPGDAEARSSQDLETVLALDPESAEAHTLLAIRAYVRDWDWPRAEREFRRALAGGGSHANAHNLYGWALMTRGRFDDAHRHFDAALEIDPLVQTGARSNSAVAWLLERKFENAKRGAQSILQLNPKSTSAYLLLSWIALAQNDCEALGGIQKTWWELVPGENGWINPVVQSRCNPGEARKALEEVTNAGSHRYFAPFTAAEAYGVLGDRERALEFLNKSAEEKSDTILYLQVDPLLDSVRDDPRVHALARRIGLPDSPPGH